MGQWELKYRNSNQNQRTFQITRMDSMMDLYYLDQNGLKTYIEVIWKAGSDCIETNTFGSNQIKLQEYGFGEQTVSINKSAAELANSVVKEFASGKKFVVGSLGPTGYLPSSNDPDLGNVPLNEIIDAFDMQAQGLILGGVDVLLIETSQDILDKTGHNRII